MVFIKELNELRSWESWRVPHGEQEAPGCLPWARNEVRAEDVGSGRDRPGESKSLARVIN